MDVGIQVFTSPEVTAEIAREEGTHPQIRKAELHFVPCHLKATLQQSGQWGAVRLIPAGALGDDLLVTGTVLKSNGRRLEVGIEARDAAGNLWLERTYEAEVSPSSYAATRIGEKDAFQDLYNRIANDLAEQRMERSAAEIGSIRTVAKLKFAQSYAPEAYEGYLKKEPNGRLVVNRLPAEGDPMMARILKIRGRENMFVDALNQQYEGFYSRMWPSYEDWRKSSLEEHLAKEKIQQDAMLRQVAGALLLAGAVVLGAKRGEVGVLEVGMGIIGGQVILNGINLSKQAEMHSEAIRELSETFGSEMKPIVLEFEGRQVELTGPAEEQFTQWRGLLREIYRAETGFEPAAPAPALP
jgi:hypothetical protein